MSEELVEIFKRLSEKIEEIRDVKLLTEITDIFVELIARSGKVMLDMDKLKRDYRDLVRKLAECERARESMAKTICEAEYNKKYYVMD